VETQISHIVSFSYYTSTANLLAFLPLAMNYSAVDIGYLWPITGQTGYAGRGLLRHCAASRKVRGWIPDGVVGIFH